MPAFESEILLAPNGVPLPPRDERYTFCVAVLGVRNFADAEHLSRLMQLLVVRNRDHHRIALISAGTDSPELTPWAHDLGWTIFYEPALRNPVKQDCAILAMADAVVVLGDSRPWSRLLRLAHEAKIPTRVFERPPRLPKPADYPTGLE